MVVLMITCDAFVTHTRGFRGQTNISSKQDDFSTFSTKALDIYKLPHSLKYMSTTKWMTCFKTSNIFYSRLPRIVKIFRETGIAVLHLLLLSNYLVLTSHVSQTKCTNFHWNARFFLLNLVCWNKDRRLNQFSRPKFEFDSAHVKYGF